MSHRSGETEDNTIADLAAVNCGQIKTVLHRVLIVWQNTIIKNRRRAW
jgi:hypothetical protein